MKTPVLSDKLIQIPATIYDSLGLHEGMELECELQENRLVAKPAGPTPRLARAIRERARSWRLRPGQNQHLERQQREGERSNDHREGGCDAPAEHDRLQSAGVKSGKAET
jgi:antitoxin component of MazEF toxin-antitoxin module